MTCINQCPVYVINLDLATERMIKMDQQLSANKINYTRITAVKGVDLTQQEIDSEYCPKLNKKHFRAELSLGEIGCYISHKNVWRKMVTENIPYAIILEDDMLLEDNFINLFKMIDSLKNYELIKLADNRNHKAKHNKKLEQQFELINFKKIPNCATGYILNLQGAKKLLSREKFYRPVDIDMQFCSELDLSVYGLRPYPISENVTLDSNITTLNGGYHGKRSTSFLRNVKYRLHLWYLRKRYISGVL